jgi:hypothetical protein
MHKCSSPDARMHQCPVVPTLCDVDQHDRMHQPICAHQHTTKVVGAQPTSIEPPMRITALLRPSMHQCSTPAGSLLGLVHTLIQQSTRHKQPPQATTRRPPAGNNTPHHHHPYVTIPTNPAQMQRIRPISNLGWATLQEQRLSYSLPCGGCSLWLFCQGGIQSRKTCRTDTCDCQTAAMHPRSSAPPLRRDYPVGIPPGAETLIRSTIWGLLPVAVLSRWDPVPQNLPR